MPKGNVIYAGNELQKRSSGITVMPWSDAASLLQ